MVVSVERWNVFWGWLLERGQGFVEELGLEIGMFRVRGNADSRLFEIGLVLS